jgi:hypothetical protein
MTPHATHPRHAGLAEAIDRRSPVEIGTDRYTLRLLEIRPDGPFKRGVTVIARALCADGQVEHPSFHTDPTNHSDDEIADAIVGALRLIAAGEMPPGTRVF